MPKNRIPTNKSSWIGMAAHEIDEITPYGASLSAKIARQLADAVVETGQDLLATEPRALARANYSAEAREARLQREVERAAESRRILGDDDFDNMLAQHREATRVRDEQIEAANRRDEDDYSAWVTEQLRDQRAAA